MTRIWTRVFLSSSANGHIPTYTQNITVAAEDQIAAEDPNRARSLYHDLSVFMQDIFVEVLEEHYPTEAILEAFSHIDKKMPPRNTIEKLYAVIKEYINKYDSLRFQGRPIWEL